MEDIFNFLINYNDYNKNKKIIRVNKNLFIGGLLSTRFIKKYNIDLVINLNTETINFDLNIKTINIPLPDQIKKSHVNKYKLIFQELKILFQEHVTANFNILIYCLSGISKSPAVSIYLLMENRNDILYILKKLKKKNSWICPNKNYLQFIYQIF